MGGLLTRCCGPVQLGSRGVLGEGGGRRREERGRREDAAVKAGAQGQQLLPAIGPPMVQRVATTTTTLQVPHDVHPAPIVIITVMRYCMGLTTFIAFAIVTRY